MDFDPNFPIKTVVKLLLTTDLVQGTNRGKKRKTPETNRFPSKAYLISNFIRRKHFYIS